MSARDYSISKFQIGRPGPTEEIGQTPTFLAALETVEALATLPENEGKCFSIIRRRHAQAIDAVHQAEAVARCAARGEGNVAAVFALSDALDDFGIATEVRTMTPDHAHLIMRAEAAELLVETLRRPEAAKAIAAAAEAAEHGSDAAEAVEVFGPGAGEDELEAFAATRPKARASAESVVAGCPRCASVAPCEVLNASIASALRAEAEECAREIEHEVRHQHWSEDSRNAFEKAAKWIRARNKV